MEQKFIQDKQGNKQLPITHMNAVRDSQGNTLTSLLGAFEDEVRGLVSTPHQEYVTVATYSALPAEGSEDTIYRVSNYDGSQSQVSAGVYSEYAWNGTQYVFLRVNSAAGEVFDITEYNSNTKYADLAAALGTGGANIPQNLRKGGMSVKFVQSSDNKYVQYRLMATAWSTTPANWQGVDEEPVVESKNLVESSGVYNELYTRKESSYSFKATDTNKTSGYLIINGNIGSPTSTSYYIHYFPITKGDRLLLKYSSFTSSSSAAYAIYSTDNPSEISSSTALYVSGIGAANVDYNIDITNDNAKLLCVQTHKSGGVYNDWGCILKKITYASKFDEIGNSIVADMIASRDFTANGNVVYDDNEIPQSYNIKWADGTAGTVVLSNFNFNVFEYTTITATYKTHTVVYTLTYDSNGYITNETLNIQ